MNKSVVLLLAICLCISVNAFALDVANIISSLDTTKQSIDSTLAGIDKDIKAAAGDLSNTDLKGDAARKILNGLLKDRPYVVDCSIIDSNGLKITVEPQTYKEYEGADRSSLASVESLLKTKKPVLSDVYHAAEGMHAISVGYPIFSSKGDFMGAVRMLIRYEVFLKPLAQGKPCKIWVMQKNGLLVYDADPDEIGHNIFSDDIFKPFKDLIDFSKTVSASENGFGSYSFYANGINDKTLVQKLAAWDTVGLYGTQWRVVAMEIDRPLAKPESPKVQASSESESLELKPEPVVAK